MKSCPICFVQFLLWMCYTSQDACKAPAIDYGEIISAKKETYHKGDKVQYKCQSGYDLEGSEWVACKKKKWDPPPKCLAPCNITSQELAARKLHLAGGERHSMLVQNNHTVEFICNKGYSIVSPSIRKCMNGIVDFPTCVLSVPGKESSTFHFSLSSSSEQLTLSWNLSTPVICSTPEVNNGNFLPVQSRYRLEQMIQVECHSGYTSENPNTSSKCTKLGWSPHPNCIQQCFRPKHLPHGEVAPESYNSFIEGEEIYFSCEEGYHPEHLPAKSKCTKDGWSPFPNCSSTQAKGTNITST
ncbi:complement factor H-related protein 2-like isoform X4 [Hemicordylus capensis]|uniref:complement factor H-related protein 2-like isoform X4 n=1 Tax=Hemicordylus capensis TaxID=884348 RepID=UPI002304A685|nr:complement factor H-related protein 2-like isoform X4 [Hemicordylus capensis]